MNKYLIILTILFTSQEVFSGYSKPRKPGGRSNGSTISRRIIETGSGPETIFFDLNMGDRISLAQAGILVPGTQAKLPGLNLKLERGSHTNPFVTDIELLPASQGKGKGYRFLRGKGTNNPSAENEVTDWVIENTDLSKPTLQVEVTLGDKSYSGRYSLSGKKGELLITSITPDSILRNVLRYEDGTIEVIYFKLQALTQRGKYKLTFEEGFSSPTRQQEVDFLNLLLQFQ